MMDCKNDKVYRILTNLVDNMISNSRDNSSHSIDTFFSTREDFLKICNILTEIRYRNEFFNDHFMESFNREVNKFKPSLLDY